MLRFDGLREKLNSLVGVIAATAAMSVVSTANGTEELAVPDPIIFFVAKGERNACGPGCDEWIAAEGVFDGAAAVQRFRDIIASLNGRTLPIYFNSRGGRMYEARIIGRILREHHMKASVGRTLPVGCRTDVPADKSCRRIMQSSRQLPAELRTAGAICSSACVHAFIGASLREVPKGARVGVHAPLINDDELRKAGGTVQQEDMESKRYVLQTGVSPRLIELSAKTPFAAIHVLNRAEIAELGLETRGTFETEWIWYENRSSTVKLMMKAITQAKGSDGKQYRTTNIGLSCLGSTPMFSYLRELAPDEIGIPTVIQVTAGDSSVVLEPRAPDAALDRRAAIADRAFVRKALAAGTIVLTERFSPPNATDWSREVRVSAAGLQLALDSTLKNCSAR